MVVHHRRNKEHFDHKSKPYHMLPNIEKDEMRVGWFVDSGVTTEAVRYRRTIRVSEVCV